MTDRRQFLSVMAAATGGLTAPSVTRVRDRTTVEAETTVFYAQPDGARNLVRFTVSGVDAPAGRLRVYDRRRTLLGTAGVLRNGDALYGELWLQLTGQTTVTSELEAPGVRGPLRSRHMLTPERRWTVYLLSVVDPEDLLRELDALEPLQQGVRLSLYARSGVRVNPLPTRTDFACVDHLEFLRLAERAVEVENRFGIPMSAAAFGTPGQPLLPTVPLALSGAGVNVLTFAENAEEPFRWWEWSESARVLVVSVPAAEHASALRISESQRVSTQRIEALLTQTPFLLAPTYRYDAAILVNTEALETPNLAQQAVAEWNSRFAFPRIITEQVDGLITAFDRRKNSSIPVTAFPGDVGPVPDLDGLTQIAKEREIAVHGRTNAILQSIGLLVTDSQGLAGVARRIGALAPGSLVFNPSPYTKSELVSMTDGSVRVATDVPGIGYAYFPDEPGTTASDDLDSWQEFGSERQIDGMDTSVRIDPDAGGVASLTMGPDQREWVAAGSPGINAVQGARLDRIIRKRIPGVAQRLITERWSPGRGTFTTTITTYDHLPWVDIENVAETVVRRAIPYVFSFDVPSALVTWEVPGGSQDAVAPIQRLAHLRWLRLENERGALLFSAVSAPFASITETGTLISHAPRGRSSYRLAAEPAFAARDERWVFGWTTEPFAVARVPSGGPGGLPTYGRLLAIERAGIAVLALKPADDGNGVILYLQELLGVDRRVTVGPDLLRFEEGVVVDFLERDQDRLLTDVNGIIQVDVRAHGIVAVRLLGTALVEG